MNLTYNIELITNQEEKEQIVSFLTLQKDIVNYISANIFNKKPILSLKIIHDQNYNLVKTEYSNAPSQLIIKSEQEALSNYKTLKSNKHKIDEPVLKHNLSVRLDKRLYSNFTQTSIKLNIGLDKRVIFKFKLYDKVVELFSKYKPSDPLMFVKHNRIFLACTFEIPETLIKDETILGIDLGMRRMFTTSDGDSLSSSEYLKTKRKIRYLKRCLQSKGTKKSKKHLKKAKRKEFNYSKNYTHHIANSILKTDKSIIVMEDLSKIKTKKNKYQNLNAKSQIPFFMLRTILTYKAPLHGKKVVTVNQSYTSLNDCRNLENGIRKGCRYYAVDGCVYDADWNASINIANRYSEHPIPFRLPVDGGLNFVGRLLSTSQSKNDLVFQTQPSLVVG